MVCCDVAQDLTSAASAGKRQRLAQDREGGALRRHAAATLVAVVAVCGLAPLTRRGAGGGAHAADDKVRLGLG